MILKKIHFGDGVKIGSVVGRPTPDALAIIPQKRPLARIFT